MSEEERPVFKLGEPVDREITGDTGVPLFPFSPQMPPRPAWPLFPFDAECFTETTPRPDCADVIRLVVPDFAPELHPQDWLLAAESAFASGRTRAEVRAMSYDDIATCFRDLAARSDAGSAAVSPGDLPIAAPPTAPQSPEQNETTADLLARMWSDPHGRRKLLNCRSAKEVAFVISRGETQVKKSPTWNKHLKHALAANRSTVRALRNEEREKGLR